ncbi:MAG: acyl-CoA thioesterase [Bacteroidales bacterium]|jgi:acyl-CoA thioester hydrolase|nr:acyl-CoA thioesterase [Bacteroidales bacterium]
MEENNINYHKIPIQIRFSDMDALGHVNNSFYAQYYDVGRINYFEDVLGGKLNWSDVTLVIVHIEIDFIHPICQGDEVYVQSSFLKFGEKSMKMYQRIVDKKTNEIKSKCTTILSGFNRKNNSSEIIPEELKEKFISYQEK